MGYNTYTTDDLVNDILLLGHVPTANTTFTASQILRLATIEMQTPLMKQILSTRGNYYLTYSDYAIASDGLYDIPSEAVGGGLYNVEQVQNTTIIPVEPIEETEQLNTQSPTSGCYGYFFRGNQVQILPIPNIGIVRLWYIKRTSTLVETTAACQITSIASNVYTVSSVPTNIITGVTLDGCGENPPFNVLGTQIATVVSGTNITLTTAITDLAVGDWLALTQQTPVVPIPVEFRIVLAQRVVCKIYELQGYMEKLSAAQAKLAEYERDLYAMISPRATNKSKVINARLGGFWRTGNRRMINFQAGKNG